SHRVTDLDPWGEDFSAGDSEEHCSDDFEEHHFGVDTRETHLIYATGAAQVEPERRALREDAIFDLASLTKVVLTTTAILLLLERGQLSLDQPVTDVFP